jgi:protein-L-isoaspartate(D-aspartate) O-methyltransferase
VLVSDVVEAALRAVPREAFVPADAAGEAYADHAIVTKVVGGEARSSISQPTMIVWMLEALAVEPGHRVLEVGAGTGYNAALLAELGADRVVTIDVDAAVAADAAAVLARLGYAGRVRVVAGDGRRGCPEEAPFDRIVVTAGAERVEPAWAEQLAEGGRIVVPLEGPREAHVLVKEGDVLTGPVATSGAWFIPLRD